MTAAKSKTKSILGIDVGGSGIKAAPVDVENGKLLKDRERIETPASAEPLEMLEIIDKLITKFKWKDEIGCGFPGVVKKGVIHTAANLSPLWVGIDLSCRLKKFTKSKVSIINDADAAGLAEMKFGAALEGNFNKEGIVLILTLGTGIGSALFVDGKLVENTEFGHIEIRGKEAEKRAANAVRENKDLKWKKWGKRVNEYLLTMEKLISPDLIIIGGGVSKKFEKFSKYLEIKTPIRPAGNQNEAGIIGAALSVER